MTYDVYICYSEYDSYIASQICKRLEKDKRVCFYAERDLTDNVSGDTDELRNKAVKESRLMVLIFTDYSNVSPQVRGEVDTAIVNSIPVIPFKLTEQNPSGGMEYYLSTLHWLDALDKPLDKSISELSKLVKNFLEGSIDEENRLAPGKRIRFRKPRFRNILVLIGSVALIVFACLAFYVFSINPVFNNPTAVFSLFAGAASTLLGIYFALRSLFIFRLRRLFLVTMVSAGALLAAMGVWIVLLMLSAPAGVRISNQSKDRSMNMSNRTISVFSFTDNTVEYPIYYADTVDGVPGIYKSSIDNFKANKPGVCLISGVVADNLALTDNSKLFYRDITDNRNELCVLDLASRSTQTLRKTPADSYFAADNWVMFDYDLKKPYGLGIATDDGKYESIYLQDSVDQMCCSNEYVYYIMRDKGLCRRNADGSSTLVSEEIKDFYIFFDNYIYYTGADGHGIYKAYLKHPEKTSKISDISAKGMIAFKGHLYYINADDDNKLYKISFDGENNEKLSDDSYSVINAVEEVLHLKKSDGTYERYRMDDSPG